MPHQIIFVTSAEPMYLYRVVHTLQASGYAWVHALVSTSPFRTLSVARPHLILLDIDPDNPDASVVTLNQIRLHPDLARVPVLLSVHAQQLGPQYRAALDALHCTMLPKPFADVQLLTLVEQVLGPPLFDSTFG